MTEGATMERSWLTRLMWIVWPAFLIAGIAETVFFALFDPFDLHLFLAPHEVSREAIYTLGFIGFWAVGIASSALTVLLGRSPYEVNRCPLPGTELPVGCPKREETGTAGLTGS
jgi:hypothetical protein